MSNGFEKFERLSVDEKSAETFEAKKKFNSEQLKKQAGIRQKQRNKHLEIEHDEFVNFEKEIDDEFRNIAEYRITTNNLSEFLNEYFPNNPKATEFAKSKILENEVLSTPIFASELKVHVSEKLHDKETYSAENQAKTVYKQLKKEGKPNTEILQTLITTFKNNENLKKWSESWQRFLELSEFAKTKPLQERRAIEKIVSNADFMDTNSFTTALQRIEQSSEISNTTKLEIREKFGATDIQTVSGMDTHLKNIKTYKKDVEKRIDTKEAENETIEKEIADLEDEIEKLDPTDPKRAELEQQLEKKKQEYNQNESELKELNESKPEKVEFLLRSNLSARLNSNGSREIRILNENFIIKLPPNTLFNDTKNLRAVNLAFPAIALRKVRMLSAIFTPTLESGTIPDKQQRRLGHTILNELGFDDKRILPQHEAEQLIKDIATLKKNTTQTGAENLLELGILDTENNLDKIQFKKALRYIREQRGTNLDFERLKEFLRGE